MRGVTACVVLLAVLVPAFGRADPASVVVSRDTTYLPGSAVYQAPLIVPAGSTLLYAVLDPSVGHTFTADQVGEDGLPLFDSVHTMRGFETNEVRFREHVEIDTAGLAPGTYAFHCEFHDRMRGALTVVHP